MGAPFITVQDCRNGRDYVGCARAPVNWCVEIAGPRTSQLIGLHLTIYFRVLLESD